MTMQPGENGGAAGATNGIAAHVVEQNGPFARDAVDVGRLVYARAVCPDGIDRVVVAKNEEDVGP